MNESKQIRGLFDGNEKATKPPQKIIHLVIGGCCFWCFSCCLCNLIYDNIANTDRHYARSVSECLWIKKLTQLIRQKKRPVHHQWVEFYDDTNRIATIEHVLVAMDGCVCPLCHQMWDHDLQCAKAIATCFFLVVFKFCCLLLLVVFLCVLVWFGFFQTLFFFSLLFLCCRSYILHFNHTNTPEQWEKNDES